MSLGFYFFNYDFFNLAVPNSFLQLKNLDGTGAEELRS